MHPDVHSDTLYTYADYEKWDDGNRYELIDGSMFVMEPGASEAHQIVNGKLHLQLGTFFENSEVKVFLPPFDICINAEGDNDKTVVQPDLFIVCDLSKLDGKRCNGTPDFVIEITSPYSSHRDHIRKFNIYEKAGVREYWIVDPNEKTLRVCILKNGKYEITDFIHPDKIPVSIFTDCEIDMKKVFT